MTARLTYNDMLSAYGHYPAPIRPYLLRAETHPGIRSILTKSFLRVFIDVLSRAPIADPARPIKVRVDAIATRLDVSVKTVSRTLRLMRSNSWLTPAPSHDGRNNYGEFAAREYIVEAPLRHLLGLPDSPLPPATASTEMPEEGMAPFAKDRRDDDELDGPIGVSGSSQGHCDGASMNTFAQIDAAEPAFEPIMSVSDGSVNNIEFETKMSDGPIRVNKVFLKEASFSNEASPKRLPKATPTPKIPTDLVPLHRVLAIDLKGVCKLMGQAKAVGQRLQDVWIAKMDYILSTGAKGGRAKNLIASLLDSGDDFSYRARLASTVDATPSRAAALDAIGSRHRYWNRKYQGAHGLHVHIHGDGSVEMTDQRGLDSYLQDNEAAHVYAMLAEGTLWDYTSPPQFSVESSAQSYKRALRELALAKVTERLRIESEAKVKREIEALALPTGMAANMTAIRAMLGKGLQE